MPALTAGKTAPDVNIPTLDGAPFKLREALAAGPVLLAFFKISCPVCQMTFPYLERIHKAYPDSKLRIVGVSQNDAAATKAFLREYGVTFPIALDDSKSYAASNAYRITNVPTLLLVAPDGSIQLSSVGWSRADVEQVAAEASATSSHPKRPLFSAQDQVPDFKAG